MRDETDEKTKRPKQRRPYSAPRIEESGRFEHLILSCGQNVALNCGGFDSPPGPLSS